VSDCGHPNHGKRGLNCGCVPSTAVSLLAPLAPTTEDHETTARKIAETLLAACDKHGPIAPAYAGKLVEPILAAALSEAVRVAKIDSQRETLTGIRDAFLQVRDLAGVKYPQVIATLDNMIAVLVARSDAQATPAPEATHRCKVCDARWRLNPPTKVQPDGSWSLVSSFAGPKCCDNKAMGDQIEALPKAGEEREG
jgi:hypothetical protein